MCEIPSNVTLAAGFAEIFDGFSIGSNDLRQLMLGVDRDSELVPHLFDERNDAVKQTIAQVIRASHAAGRKIGICGRKSRVRVITRHHDDLDTGVPAAADFWTWGILEADEAGQHEVRFRQDIPPSSSTRWAKASTRRPAIGHRRRSLNEPGA